MIRSHAVPTFWPWHLLLLVALILAMLAAPVEARSADYRLGYGDALTVTVVGQPTLSVTGQPVRPDGRISLPLIAQVEVKGQTVEAVTAALVKAYRLYVPNPHVVVQVDRFRPLRVTVLGQVGRPGIFEFAETPSLIDAIASAGGLTERAARGHVKVVAPGQAARVYDLEQFLGGGEAPPLLVEGMIVEVGEVWYPDYNRMVPLTASLLTAAAILIQITGFQIGF